MARWVQFLKSRLMVNFHIFRIFFFLNRKSTVAVLGGNEISPSGPLVGIENDVVSEFSVCWSLFFPTHLLSPQDKKFMLKWFSILGRVLYLSVLLSKCYSVNVSLMSDMRALGFSLKEGSIVH